MRTIIALGIAAVLTLAVIVSWVTATAHSNNQAEASAAFGDSINPFELMKKSKDLPHHQYDAF
jgi:type II secretory pathway pseudopilin PulG